MTSGCSEEPEHVCSEHVWWREGPFTYFLSSICCVWGILWGTGIRTKAGSWQETDLGINTGVHEFELCRNGFWPLVCKTTCYWSQPKSTYIISSYKLFNASSLTIPIFDMMKDKVWTSKVQSLNLQSYNIYMQNICKKFTEVKMDNFKGWERLNQSRSYECLGVYCEEAGTRVDWLNKEAGPEGNKDFGGLSK